MPAPRPTKEKALEIKAAIETALTQGFTPFGKPRRGSDPAKATAIVAPKFEFSEAQLRAHVKPGGNFETWYGVEVDWDMHQPTDPNREPISVESYAKQATKILRAGARTMDQLKGEMQLDVDQVLDVLDHLSEGGVQVIRTGGRWSIPKEFVPAFHDAEILEFPVDENGRYVFGTIGDNHCGSKYERRDVLEDLYDRFAEAGVRHVFHCGNWIEGESRFNKHDLVAHGLEPQCQMLAQSFPQRDGITTYAVWGDDHEGWYAQREGIDVGRYAEGVFRMAGREDWVNLGFMEAHVAIVNPETGARSTMAVTHQGGGSSYALSYRPQKIIESLEGGEKPAILLIGHYHKLDGGLVRNVWYLQVGTTQDQTPFMRKKAIEAHIGGAIVECEQDPNSGAIVAFRPELRRYFNTDFYATPRGERWSHHGPVVKPKRTVMGQ